MVLSTIPGAMTFDELQEQKDDHPVINWLPENTGSINPVSYAVVRGDVVYLAYSPLRDFVSARQLRGYTGIREIDDPFREKPDNRTQLFDDLSMALFREEQQHQTYRTFTDPEDYRDAREHRRALTSNRYIDAASIDGVIGGAWKERQFKPRGSRDKVQEAGLYVREYLATPDLVLDLITLIRSETTVGQLMFYWNSNFHHNESREERFSDAGLEIKEKDGPIPRREAVLYL